MTAISRIYAIARAALMLAISEELLEALADTLDPEDGAVWVYDSTEHGTRGFTDQGLDNVREMLNDPSIINRFLQKPL